MGNDRCRILGVVACLGIGWVYGGASAAEPGAEGRPTSVVVAVAGRPAKGAEPIGGELRMPFGVDADAENHVIRKLLVRQKRVVRVAGTGKPGSAGVGGPPERVELDRPHGVFVDSRGTLYIADSGNDRILKIAAP